LLRLFSQIDKALDMEFRHSMNVSGLPDPPGTASGAGFFLFPGASDAGLRHGSPQARIPNFAPGFNVLSLGLGFVIFPGMR